MAVPASMKAVVYQKFGDSSVLRLADDVPVPKISPNEILVQVYFASLNPVDYKLRVGLLGFLTRWAGFPRIPGRDFSGVVAQVGSKVPDFAVGDALFGAIQGMGPSGTHAQYIKVPAAVVARKPPAVSFADAATLGVAGLTAWQALVDHVQLVKQSNVVINGASGGVGTFAVQIAKKHVGAHVYAVCSAANAELVKNLGADEVIDYTTMDFTEHVHDADAVLNNALNGGEALRRNLAVLKPAGGVLLDSNIAPISFTSLATVIRDTSALGMTLFKGAFGGKKFKPVLMKNDAKEYATLASLIENGTIKPVIEKIYTLDEFQEANARLESGRVRGKLLFRVAADA